MRTVVAGDLPIGDGHPPRIMGVLNLSPESPYAPSVFDDPTEAAEYVDGLIDEGADIIDIGLESANKRFSVRSADWELDRLALAFETIERVTGEAVFSLETRYSPVAATALDGGFDMINDIAGFADPEMPAVCSSREAAVVKMAGPGELDRPGALEAVDDIYAALADGLTDRTIVDPAFGGWSEAKSLADDRATFDRLREFQALGRPILVSINRKNFLKDVVDRETDDALAASLGATAMAVERGADVIRTHDVAATRDAALIGHTFARDRTQSAGVDELDVTTVTEAARHLEADGSGTETAPAVVSSVYRVEGLDENQQTELESAADAVGAVVSATGSRAVVGGSVASMVDLAEALASTSLSALADAIDE